MKKYILWLIVFIGCTAISFGQVYIIYYKEMWC